VVQAVKVTGVGLALDPLARRTPDDAEWMFGGSAYGPASGLTGLLIDDPRRLQWLCKKHKVASRGYSRHAERYLTGRLGLVRLPLLRRSCP
jgi:hypothetical protein